MKRNLDRLANRPFDVLVIGGGIHGALVAWDAVLRGLSVALIERGDFGSGTSQNSLKIIHGGLRYLQDGNLLRIRTMAQERTTWMKIAPHLVHPLTCLMPTRQKFSRSRLAMGVALTINDMLSFDRNHLQDPEKYLAAGRIISQQELANRLPGYDVHRSTGAAVWHDAHIHNTERLLLAFILSAAEAGVEVANYVEARGLLKDGNQIIGISARDVPSGQLFEIRSNIVLNCTGAWIDSLLETARLRSEYSTSIAMNIFVDQVWSGIAAGLPSRPTNGKPPQILFIVPWRDKSMIGTWHIPWDVNPASFELSKSNMQDFIDEINSAHPSLGLTLNDVLHVTWGFLPVNREDAHKKQVKLTRDGVVIDHHSRDGIAGLISVIGVKYTTARSVAQKAVDLAVAKLGVHAAPCQTHVTAVSGGCIDDFKAFLNLALSNRPRDMDEETVEHWVYSYGSEYPKLFEYSQAQRIDPILPVTKAEIIHCARHEMALTLADVIQRRTELGAAGLPSATTLESCAELMGHELGWTIERQQQEISSIIDAYPFRQRERVTS